MNNVYKKIFIVSVLNVLLVTAMLNAQWLETTILVPDSLCALVNPNALTYNSVNNKIYVGGEAGDCVLAVDGATNEKISQIPTGNNIKALCWNSTNNKIYSVNCTNHNVTVIDGTGDSVITTIPTGGGP